MEKYVLVTEKRDGTITNRLWIDTIKRAKYALKATKEYYRERGYILELRGADGFVVRNPINRDYEYTVFIADGKEHAYYYCAQ